MIDALRENYVLYVQEPYVSGIKNVNGSVEILALPPETLDLFSLYPNLCNQIAEGSLVQIACEGLGVAVIVGKSAYEGPYCENECLDVLAQSIDSCLFSALDKVERELSLLDKKVTVRQRLYRLYANDRFRAQDKVTK